MLQFSIYIIHRPPMYEVKAIVDIVAEEKERDSMLSSMQALQYVEMRVSNKVDQLTQMLHKLDQIVPPSFRMKFRIGNKQLIGVASARQVEQARRMAKKMEDFVHTAANELHLK